MQPPATRFPFVKILVSRNSINNTAISSVPQVRCTNSKRSSKRKKDQSLKSPFGIIILGTTKAPKNILTLRTQNCSLTSIPIVQITPVAVLPLETKLNQWISQGKNEQAASIDLGHRESFLVYFFFYGLFYSLTSSSNFL